MTNLFIIAFLVVGLNCQNYRSIQSINFDSWRNLDHDGYTGDDNGGIASGPNGDQFIFSGDDNSALFEIQGDGSITAETIPQLDGIFSDLSDGQYYTFTNNLGEFFMDDDVIRGFVPLRSNGSASGPEVLLSESITGLYQFNYDDGVLFLADAGYCHITKWNNATRIAGATYSIELATGEVSVVDQADLRAIFFNGTRYAESWAAYGVAEHYYHEDGDYVYAVAACVKNTPSRVGLCKYDILSSVPVEQEFLLFEFENGTLVDIFDEIASVTVSPIDSDTPRFYMHFEGSYNLGSGSENAGYAQVDLLETSPPNSRSSSSSASELYLAMF